MSTKVWLTLSGQSHQPLDQVKQVCRQHNYHACQESVHYHVACPDIEQEGWINHFQSLVSIHIVCDSLLGHLFAKFHSSCWAGERQGVKSTTYKSCSTVSKYQMRMLTNLFTNWGNGWWQFLSWQWSPSFLTRQDNSSTTGSLVRGYPTSAVVVEQLKILRNVTPYIW